MAKSSYIMSFVITINPRLHAYPPTHKHILSHTLTHAHTRTPTPSHPLQGSWAFRYIKSEDEALAYIGVDNAKTEGGNLVEAANEAIKNGEVRDRVRSKP